MLFGGIRGFIAGLIVGMAVMAGLCFMFGDRMRNEVAGTAAEVGRTVQKVGKQVEDKARDAAR